MSSTPRSTGTVAYVKGGGTTGRAYVITGASEGSISTTAPTNGGPIDGVHYEASTHSFGIPASRGVVALGRAGGSIADGANLQVQGDGDFVTHSSGNVVARALEAAGSGSTFWLVFV